MRKASRRGPLWDRGSRTCDGVPGSADVETWRTRTRLSAAPGGMRAGTGCRAGQGRSKEALGTGEARPTRAVVAAGRRASTISTCCCRSCPFSAATPTRAARVPADMQPAVRPEPEAAAAVGGRMVRPADGCLGPDSGPAVVVVAAVGVNSAAACCASCRGPRQSRTCCDVGNVSMAASGRGRGRVDIGEEDSTAVDRTASARACRDTAGRRWEEHVMMPRRHRAAARLWSPVPAGRRAC